MKKLPLTKATQQNNFEWTVKLSKTLVIDDATFAKSLLTSIFTSLTSIDDLEIVSLNHSQLVILTA
jgi:hypothetical protein